MPTENRAVRGVLGEKLGMTQVFDDNNRIVPVTVVKAGPCVVTQVRTPDKDGYSAVQLAYGRSTRARSPSRSPATSGRPGSPRAGTWSSCAPRRPPTTPSARRSAPDVFAAGTVVDVIGTSKGKGTAGVMKRHGFKGLGASHGTQRKHRSPGSIGGCATPGRVFKGLRMAGRMGHARTTVLQPDRARRGRREGPAAHQGRDPRPDRRPGPRPQRGEAPDARDRR